MTPKNYTPIGHLIKKYKQEQTKPFDKAQDKIKGKPKESEPFMHAKENYHLKEAVEHEPETEVQEFVKPKAETIKLPPDLQKLGLQAATTTKFPSYQNLKLPLSDEKIIANLHKPISSSGRWLATLFQYILEQRHLILRVINGKVVRVIKT